MLAYFYHPSAAKPEWVLDSPKVLGVNGDVTVKSNAAGFPPTQSLRHQLVGSRHVNVRPMLSSTLTLHLNVLDGKLNYYYYYYYANCIMTL